MTSASARAAVADAARIVVKVGSSSLARPGGGVDTARVRDLVEVLAQRAAAGSQVLLVSSGAIATGMPSLGLRTRPRDLATQQAAASVGQGLLIAHYTSAFGAHGFTVGQILLTSDDVTRRTHYRNAQRTLFRLLELGIVPIVNENDTVVTDEIKLGDNDTLGALVTNLLEADVLVILTDQSGLFTADPRKDASAQLIDQAQANDPSLCAMAGGAGSSIGTGGMATKVRAASRAAGSGADTVIASGHEPDVLVRLACGEVLGTWLRAEVPVMTARQQWLADHLTLRGRLVLDEGAVSVLRTGGKSLLPIGVTEAIGDFERGDVVACCDAQGQEVARGLVNYSANESRRILGRPSTQIEAVLGFVEEPELIHRDNLVLISSGEKR